MSLSIILQVILLGVALAMDAFAVSVVDGLVYSDINKKKSFFIAGLFGFMQALMPLIGFFLIELVEVLVGKNAGADASKILALIVTWLSFSLLVIIGGKMLFDGITGLNKPRETLIKKFSYKEVFLFSIATAIDALATGVVLHNTNASGVALSNNYTIWLHVTLIMVITFIISLIGVFLGKGIEKLLKGKISVTNIIGGIILILLAVWCVLEHYVSL